MTPKISLIIGVAAAALAFAAPALAVFPTLDGGDTGYAPSTGSTAVGYDYRGDSWGADRLSQVTFLGSPDAIDRAIAAKQREHAAMLDARERAYGTKREIQLDTGVYPDVFERAVAARERADRFVAADDRFRIDPTNQPVTVTVNGSGRELEWPQVGIGFGVGLALLLGVLLALRSRRHPPLAH